MDIHEEFQWYSREIEIMRVKTANAFDAWAQLRHKLDRMERERGELFQRLMKEAEQRVGAAG